VVADGGRPLDDVGLVRAVATGSSDALATLYDRHADAIYASASRLTSDRQVAEEVVQETFLALWNRAELFDQRLGSLAAWLVQAWWPGATAVQRVPPLPSALPGFQVPALTVETMRLLFSATLVMTLLGLTEASAIAKSLALRRGERVDGNQEFIGQGLANIAGSFFSAYPSSGSFNRSGVNIASGARTPLAAASAAVWLVAILALVKPLASYLALAAIAGLLLVVAWRLIDFGGIRRIWGRGWRANWGERAILLVTGIATLAISLEWAILLGLLTAYLVSRSRSPDPEESKTSDEEA